MLYIIDQCPYLVGFILVLGLSQVVWVVPVAVHFSRQARLGYDVLADIEWQVEEATSLFQLDRCANDLASAERYMLNLTMHDERDRIERLIKDKQNRLELVWF